MKSKDPEYKHPKIQHSKNQKIQKSKNPNIQKSKNLKIQKSKNPKNPKIPKSPNPKTNARFRRCKKFWIFGLLDFRIFCVLHLCFQSVETAPKLDSEKTAFVWVFTVFLRGVRVVGGGDHIYIYTYT